MSTDPVGNGIPQIERKATAFVSPSSGAPRERGALRTTRERAEQKRQEKLELVRQQVQSGSLVIRQMTEAERRYPPHAARANQLRGR